jgi:hypothetical protein
MQHLCDIIEAFKCACDVWKLIHTRILERNIKTRIIFKQKIHATVVFLLRGSSAVLVQKMRCLYDTYEYWTSSNPKSKKCARNYGECELSNSVATIGGKRFRGLNWMKRVRWEWCMNFWNG